MDASFFQAPVEVPRLSGFDKSFMNLYTAPCGTLVPALCDEVMPGSIIDLRMAASVSLPPLASDTFMRCSLKVETFFVPMRLCFGGFEHFFVGDKFEAFDVDADTAEVSITRLPSFSFVDSGHDTTFSNADLSGIFGAGTLSDYLGFKAGKLNSLTFTPNLTSPYWGQGEDSPFSLMPYLAYHKLWSDWYRASLIQRDCFAPLVSTTSWSDALRPISALPYVCTNDIDYGNGSSLVSILNGSFSDWSVFDYSPYKMADGVNVFQLRQRNFGFDFFTCATPSPQNGDAVSVKLDPTSLATLGNGFTISQLRSMNSLQQWRERNNLTGDRYVDRLYGQYGCRPSDGIAQRVLCLASDDIEVYSKGIYNSNNAANDSGSQNPFGGSLGARGASAYGSTGPNAITLCKGFKATEPGYLMVITSLVPRVTYASGLDSKLMRYCLPNSQGEMANPILQNIGPEPIYACELTENVWERSDIFGYTDRYGHFKAKFDELHGLVRDGESLESFALQRYLDAATDAYIDNEFLQIPRDYMDNITAVKSTISEYGCWVDSYFDYKVSMPLAKYSLPSLQDPAYEHGKTITIRRGGFRF